MAAPQHGCVGRYLANRNELRVSGSDDYALLFLQLIVVQMAEVSARLNRSWTQCVFPTLELWNDELRRVFSVPDRLSCSTVERNWVYVDNGTLRISDSAVQRHGSLSCNYTPIHRGRDDFEVFTAS